MTSSVVTLCAMQLEPKVHFQEFTTSNVVISQLLHKAQGLPYELTTLSVVTSYTSKREPKAQLESSRHQVS